MRRDYGDGPLPGTNRQGQHDWDLAVYDCLSRVVLQLEAGEGHATVEMEPDEARAVAEALTRVAGAPKNWLSRSNDLARPRGLITRFSHRDTTAGDQARMDAAFKVRWQGAQIIEAAEAGDAPSAAVEDAKRSLAEQIAARSAQPAVAESGGEGTQTITD